MNSFKSLLDTIRTANPDLISEEAAAEMLTDFDASIDKIKADASAEGQALGFKEGYDEGKKVAADEAKKEMDELIEKLDTESTEKLQAIVEMLNNEHADKLQEVYDLLMDTMVPKADVEAMDEDYANKFEEAMNAKDEYDSKKLMEAVEAINNKHNLVLEETKNAADKRLEHYMEKANIALESAAKQLADEKARKLDILTESVQKYLNYALQEAIPTKQLISEQKYNASQKAIEKITSILKINNILQESKDGIFEDYENKLASSKEANNKLVSENVELKRQLEEKEAQLVLESTIAKCVPAEAAFLKSYFKNATSSKVIEEQIEDARNAYKRMHAEKRQEAIKKNVEKIAAEPSKVVNESKETAKKELKAAKPSVVAESKEQNVKRESSIYDIYTSILNGQN